MLSRDHVIHRSAGEEREVRLNAAGARAGNNAMLRARIWAKLVGMCLAVGALAAFLLLNRGAVIEPRMHLLFFQSQRPPLLTVLLITSFVSGAGALLARAVLHALTHGRAGSSVAPPTRNAMHVNAPVVAAGASAS